MTTTPTELRNEATRLLEQAIELARELGDEVTEAVRPTRARQPRLRRAGSRC